MFSVLKGYGYSFLRKCCKPVTSLLVPYIRGVAEPTKRILATHNGKVSQNPLGHIFFKSKDLAPTLFIPYLAKTASMYILDKPNVSLVRF